MTADEACKQATTRAATLIDWLEGHGPYEGRPQLFPGIVSVGIVARDVLALAAELDRLRKIEEAARRYFSGDEDAYYEIRETLGQALR